MGGETIPSRIPVASGDLSTAMLRGMGYLVLGSRLTFDDRLDVAVLSRAVRLMLDAEPVLGCWFKERLLNAHWQRCADLDSSAYASAVDSQDPDVDAERFHGEPFPAQGPRLAVRLLRSAAHDDLCLKVDHLVADGWATKNLTYMLADYYSRLLEDPSFTPTPDLTPRPSGGDLWAMLTPEQRAAASRAEMRPAPPKWRIPVSRGSGSALHIRRLTLDPCELASLKAYGKARGATVSDMLLTALLRSFAHLAPQERGAALTPRSPPTVDDS